MKLTQNALKQINNAGTRLTLALGLGFSENWVRSCIRKNKYNGPLTTATALKIIKKETGLNQSEILTEEIENIAG